MNDSTTAVAPEALLADIWKEILGVGEVGPDDDFFSLGGDSLLALKVIGAAQEQGLSLSLLDLFKNPTPRGACRSLTRATDRPAHGALDQLSVLDRARVPADAEDAYPAARLQLGLIYESLVSDGAFYLDVISRTVLRPLDPAVLRAALDLLSARHPLLRTRFDLGIFSEPMQLVQKEAPIPLVTADHGDLTGAAATEAYEKVMAELAEPYDAESAPLLRVHAATTGSGSGSFRLSYSFHHAILDGWSESVFFNELVVAYAALLDGTRPEFADPVPYAEFVRLEREALRDEQSVRHFRDLQAELPPQREASSAEPEHRKASADVPAEDARRLGEMSARWGLPVKSLLLAANCVAVGAAWETETPAVGLLLNGRPERTGADVTLGLFLNQLPMRLDLRDADWRTAARRALDAENALLPHRRFPHSELRRLLGRNPFEVTFNYVHFHPRDELLAAGLLAADEDMRDHTSLPVRIEALDDPEGGGLSLHVTADVHRFGEELPGRLVEGLLAAIHALVTDEEAAARLPWS
ncbi:condensation domain-containing protein [Streptomyces sp. NBC_00009]|uniref:condensation domain-containing protein n=1 Tax=Streptomyces sp. NBC_00009 TaxID=2975620 RepID=UPI003255DB0B